MTLLDRFRTQPQKHPDPTVRLAYVSELPLSERDLIVAAALEDDDARVPRVAVAQLAKTSLREPVGRRAVARLDRVTDVHMLASIARHAVLEPIRQAAFDELHDRSEILTVALNGEFKDTATAAVNRLSDREDLEQVVAR